MSMGALKSKITLFCHFVEILGLSNTQNDYVHKKERLPFSYRETSFVKKKRESAGEDKIGLVNRA